MKIIYIKTTEACNLNCKHCFVPFKANQLSFETLKEIVNKINDLKDDANIIWHGGEPTLIGKEKLIKYIEYINENTDYNMFHHIQTNLMKYDNQWKDIFNKYFNSFIGVSYDFDIRFWGKDKDKEKIFWENFETLKKDNIETNMIITITKKIIENGAKEFWKWIIDKKITSLHLERLTKSGSAIENWKEIGFTNKEYNDFIYSLFKYYLMYKNRFINTDKNIHISPFDSMINFIPRDIGFSCAGKCNNFYTFNPDGTIKGCTSTEPILGNLKDKMSDIIKKNIIDKKICEDCEFSQVCKSGCSVIKEVFDDSGDCLGNYKLLKFIKEYQFKFKEDLSIENLFSSWDK